MLIFVLTASFVCSASAWLAGGLMPGTRSHSCQYLHVERRLSGEFRFLVSSVVFDAAHGFCDVVLSRVNGAGVLCCKSVESKREQREPEP